MRDPSFRFHKVVMKGREPLRLAIRGAQQFQLTTQAINVLGKTMHRPDVTEFLSMVRCKLLNYENWCNLKFETMKTINN